jgi:hypothetical protein
MPRPRRTEAALALALLASGCAGSFHPPSPGAAAALQAAPTYSAAVRVSVGGAILRGHAGAIVAWRRPDALRVEIAGPGGAIRLRFAHPAVTDDASNHAHRAAAARQAYNEI